MHDKKYMSIFNPIANGIAATFMWRESFSLHLHIKPDTIYMIHRMTYHKKAMFILFEWIRIAILPMN